MFDFTHKHFWLAAILTIVGVFLIETFMGTWAVIGIVIFVILIANRKKFTRNSTNDKDG